MPLVLFNPQIGPLSGATTPGQSGPGSNGNEGVLHIPQSSSITETIPSDSLVVWNLIDIPGLIYLSIDKCRN